MKPGTVESNRCSCSVELETRLHQAYNEEAFRHFLSMERKLSARSGRRFVLLLVGLKKRDDRGGLIDPALAAKLFSSLWHCLRETDVVGWFRNGRVAGVLLTELPESAGAELSRALCTKVRDALSGALSVDMVGRLQVRAHQLSSEPKSRS